MIVPGEWSHHVNTAVEIYNNTVHSSTSFTPAELEGKCLPTFQYSLKPYQDENNNTITPTLDSILVQMHEKAVERLDKAANLRIKRWSKRGKKNVFEIGDRVLWTVGSHKLKSCEEKDLLYSSEGVIIQRTKNYLYKIQWIIQGSTVDEPPGSISLRFWSTTFLRKYNNREEIGFLRGEEEYEGIALIVQLLFLMKKRRH